MSDSVSLIALEGLLEQFLEKVVTLKHRRLGVIGGINRLDDIARKAPNTDITDQVGEWFAEHNRWLNDDVLKSADTQRISALLTKISQGISETSDSSPATRKISSEINRWQDITSFGPRKVTVSRKPENADENPNSRSIALFGSELEKTLAIYKDASGGKKHLLSVLDDTLSSAIKQKNKEALLLSAYLIYYLKLGGYIVDPFVKRLKEAERLIKEEKAYA